jgi:hypothetical protein
VLEPNRPVVVSWDWSIPAGATTHSCLLSVISSPDDPITTTQTNVDALVRAEKRVALKNLHVINAAGPRPDQYLVPIEFHNALPDHDTLDVIIEPVSFAEGTIGLLLEPVELGGQALHGVTAYHAREGEYIGNWYQRPGDEPWLGRYDYLKQLDQECVYEFDAGKRAEIRGIPVAPGTSLQGLLTFKGSHKTPYGQVQRFSVSQRQAGQIVGGSTYEVRLRRAKGMAPVSHIRVTLDSLSLDGVKSRHKVVWALAEFNKDGFRRQWTRLPARHGVVDAHCLFDGYVVERDNLTLSLHVSDGHGLPDLSRPAFYTAQFNQPPETWVGERADSRIALSLRVESLKL